MFRVHNSAYLLWCKQWPSIRRIATNRGKCERIPWMACGQCKHSWFLECPSVLGPSSSISFHSQKSIQQTDATKYQYLPMNSDKNICCSHRSAVTVRSVMLWLTFSWLGDSNMKVTVSALSWAFIVSVSSLLAHLRILAMLARFMPMDKFRSQRNLSKPSERRVSDTKDTCELSMACN